MANSFDADNNKKKSNAFDLNFSKERRFLDDNTTEISAGMYNLAIGLITALGFVVNFIMAYKFQTQILSLPIIGVIIAYFILTLAGSFITHRTQNPFVGIAAFLVMAVGMGLLLTFILAEYELSSVYMAFALTAVIAVVITILATIVPQFFLSLGPVLMISLLVSVAAELICTFLLHRNFQIFDYVIIVIFSGYIGYNFARSQQYRKTFNNAVASAADLYLDLVNVFIRILDIMGKSKD